MSKVLTDIFIQTILSPWVLLSVALMVGVSLGVDAACRDIRKSRKRK